MKQPTTLTRVLQVGLPGYIVVSVVAMWIVAARKITTLAATGRVAPVVVVVSALALITFGALLVAYGGLRTWRWAFWGNVVVALLFAVNPKFGWLAYLGDLILAVLLVLSVIAVMRSGPWGLRTMSFRAGPG